MASLDVAVAGVLAFCEDVLRPASAHLRPSPLDRRDEALRDLAVRFYGSMEISLQARNIAQDLARFRPSPVIRPRRVDVKREMLARVSDLCRDRRLSARQISNILRGHRTPSLSGNRRAV